MQENRSHKIVFGYYKYTTFVFDTSYLVKRSYMSGQVIASRPYHVDPRTDPDTHVAEPDLRAHRCVTPAEGMTLWVVAWPPR